MAVATIIIKLMLITIKITTMIAVNSKNMRMKDVIKKTNETIITMRKM